MFVSFSIHMLGKKLWGKSVRGAINIDIKIPNVLTVALS